MHVDGSRPNDNGNGLSWAKAKKTIQSAINYAKPGDTIWIKEGVHFPTTDHFKMKDPTDPRDKTFRIKPGVVMMGGFDGTETHYSQRDVEAHRTILSGNIGDQADSTDNCYHVVFAIYTDSSTVLDGLEISDGVANSDELFMFDSIEIYRRNGAGLSLVSGNLKMNKVTLKHNHATANGAGMLGYLCDVKIAHCSVLNNFSNYSGGGMAFFNSDVAIQNSSIVNNESGRFGGGLNASFVNLKVDSTSVRANKVLNFFSGRGGGILINNTNAKFFSNVIDSNVSASQQAGVACWNSDFDDELSIYKNNIAVEIFTGAYSAFSGLYSNVKLDKIVFENNLSNKGSSAVALRASDTYISNSIFINNENRSFGNAIFATADQLPNQTTVNNCIFYDNLETKKGKESIIYDTSGSSSEYNNCIFWNNHPGVFRKSADAEQKLNNCIVEGGFPGNNNLDVEPQFLDVQNPKGADGIWFTADDGFQPLNCSAPQVNAGDNQKVFNVVPYDALGQNRVQMSLVDIGPYEYRAGSRLDSDLMQTSFEQVIYHIDHTDFGKNCGNLFASASSPFDRTHERNIDAKFWYDNSTNNNYVRRHFEFNPKFSEDTTALEFKLYFTQEDFDEFNALATSKLPQSPNDEEGMQNVLIVKHQGSSQDGTGTPDSYNSNPQYYKIPMEDVLWNASYDRWEIKVHAAVNGGLWLRDIKGVFVGNQEVVDSENLLVSPNPFGSELRVSVQAGLADKIHAVEVFNSVGQIILSQSFTAASSDLIIPTSNWQQGMYFVKLTDAKGNLLTSKKVIKHVAP